MIETHPSLNWFEEEEEEKNHWYYEGIFRTPTIRSRNQTMPKGLTSHEVFFNVLFTAAFGYAKVDVYLVQDYDHAAFLLYFFAWWSAYAAITEYSMQYNDNDFTHKIFWAIYGLGIMSMIIHTNGGLGSTNCIGFMNSIGSVNIIVAVMTLRASVLEEARVSAIWHGCTHVVIASIWFYLGVTNDGQYSWHQTGLWAMAVLTAPISSSLFLLYDRHIPHVIKVPIEEKYYVAKYTTICIMVLASSIVGAASGVNPDNLRGSQKWAARFSCLAGLLTFINLKILVVDVDTLNHSDHALKNGTIRRLMWQLQQPFMVCAMVAAAAGCGSLMQSSDYSNPPQFGYQVASHSLAVIYILIIVQRTLHRQPRHFRLMESAGKGIWHQSFITIAQIAIALLQGGLPHIFPLVSVPLILSVIASLATLTVALNLIITHQISVILRKLHTNHSTFNKRNPKIQMIQMMPIVEASESQPQEHLRKPSMPLSMSEKTPLQPQSAKSARRHSVAMWASKPIRGESS